MDEELDAFKSRIDLREYMATQGYQLDRRDSSERSAIMRGPGHDKLIVAIGPKAPHYWIYCSVHDDRDQGTILDFITHRKRLNTGQIRKELRPWIGRPASALPLFSPLQPALKDHVALQREYSRMKLAGHHLYLEQERRIPGSLLASPRFVGRVRVDEHGNAIFPHFDLLGLCGFEKKNRGFTGFATGGTKGLWGSLDLPDDARLVVAESAIDALSYAALFPDARARYRSIGGQVNDQQPALIRAAVLDLPDGSEVIAATDNDDAGRKLAAMIEKVVADAGRPTIAFRAHLPVTPGTDWNQTLKNSFPIVPVSALAIP